MAKRPAPKYLQIGEILRKLAGRLEIKNADERRQVRPRQAVLQSSGDKGLPLVVLPAKPPEPAHDYAGRTTLMMPARSRSNDDSFRSSCFRPAGVRR